MNTILIVDDSPVNLRHISSLLREHYETRIAVRGSDALQMLQEGYRPDLILLDIEMPGMSGYEVCSYVKANTETLHIPVVFLTSRNTEDDEELGLKLGGADFLTKPVRPAILLARVNNLILIERAKTLLSQRNTVLEAEIADSSKSIAIANESLVDALIYLSEYRDNETGAHILRTAKYVETLGLHLTEKHRYRGYLTENDVLMIAKCAPLHDIGKIGIPDSILLKSGRLTQDEFSMMKRHASLGRDALDKVMQERGRGNEYLSLARDIAGSHHERWDGSGYPDGLKGEDIPLCARLMAVADVYDALVNSRVYKPAIPHHKAVEIISQGSGTAFDPEIVTTFLECAPIFNEIHNQYLEVPRA